MRNISIALLIFVLLATLCQAQNASSPSSQNETATAAVSSGTTALEGTVTDASGAVVVGATVTVRNAAGESKTAVTNGEGKYRITGLAPGQYNVSVTAKGFAEFKTEGLNMTSGESVSLDAPLQAAGSSTEVNVEGQRATQVETENAEVSGTLTQKQIVSIALNGRNFSTLIALAPGVSNQTGQDEAKVGVVGSAKYSVNGGRTEYNTFSVDGTDVLNTDIAASHGHSTLLVYPSLDAIQELKVLTSNYGAEYGRSASGTTLVTPKSGGPRFHGNAYEFLRNEAFNSRNYFDAPGKAPLYRRNDYGFTVGGPLFIPHVYNTNKNKTFFFVSEEFRQEKSPYEFNQAVPSDAERGWNPVTQSYSSVADFSDVCPAIVNAGETVDFDRSKFPDCPSQGTSNQRRTFTDNRFLIDPVASTLLKAGLVPRANSAVGCNFKANPDDNQQHCYVTAVSPSTSWREDLLRIDHNFGSKTQLSLTGIHDHWETSTAVPQWENQPNSFPSVLNRFIGPGTSGSVHVTTMISPTFLNTFSFGITVQNINLADQPGAGVSLDRSPLDALQFPMGRLFNNGFGGKLPAIVIGGNNAIYGGTGLTVDTAYMPWSHRRGTIEFLDSINKVIGKHTLQVGVQYIKARRHEINAANGANSGDTQGVLTFKNIGSIHTSDNAFADFLYNFGSATLLPSGGQILSYQQDSAQSSYRVRYWIIEPYVQDDWHVTPRLVVNLGMRVSLFGNWQPEGGALYNWQASAYDPTLMAKANLVVDYQHGYLKNVTNPLAPSPLPLDVNNLNAVMTNGLVACGKNGVPASCQSSHVFNPAPRIGFAWDPTGQGKISIRGGYGVFFEHGTGSEANAGSLMGNPPQVLSMQEDNPLSYQQIGYYTGNPKAEVPYAYPLNVISIPAKTVWPYVQQWSFGVQQEIAKDTAITVSYVGSKGTHLAVAMQRNQLRPVSDANNPFGPGEPLTSHLCASNQIPLSNPYDPLGFFTLSNGSKLYYKDNPIAVLALIAACDGTPAPPGFNSINFSLNLLRPYQGIGGITAIENVASSVYHSMQFTLRHNHGPLDLGISYTYGHSLDSASDRFESNFVDAFDLAANRASSDFDQRHLLNITYLYQLPMLRLVEHLRSYAHCQDCPSAPDLPPYGGPSKLTRTLLDGWAVQGITTYQSGTPFSVVNGASSTGISQLDNAGFALGLGADSYPDLASGSNCNTANSSKGTVGPLLANPCMFVAPRGLTQGNAGRNFLNNPGRTNFDMSLLKNFNIGGEQRTLQFRAEAFNIFNQTQFITYDPIKGNTASNTISCYDTTTFSAGAPGCLAGNGFLHPVEAHRPRTLQFGLKLQF
ncbi:MAG TPA: carboxypeptidase regulatory-like domain-containing protein [Terriglobales bacterium]|nr:carboxypeptidase regulatory-like domain-containing protein [Terriglobales bacterium]